MQPFKALEPLLQSTIRLLRVHTYLVICIQLLIAVAVVSNSSGRSLGTLVQQYSLNFFLCWICIAFWYIHATSLNDLADYEIDKINLPKDQDRPLVLGEVNKKLILAISILTGTLGLITSLLIAPQAVQLIVVMLALNWAYSMPPIRISYRGGLAQLLLPIGYVAFPYLLGIIAFDGALTQQALTILLGLYLLFCSRVLLKDFRDVRGDQRYRKMTFLLRHSVATVVKVATVAYALGITILSVEILHSNFRIIVIPTVFIAGITLVLFNELATTKNWQEQRPLLAPIGRLITAQSLLFLLAILSKSEGFTLVQATLLAVAITFSMTWSSYVSLSQEPLKKG